MKILQETLKHLETKKGQCINLSPVRWLQDPLAKEKKNSDYKKFEEILSHLRSLDVVDEKLTNGIFGISFGPLRNL